MSLSGSSAMRASIRFEARGLSQVRAAIVFSSRLTLWFEVPNNRERAEGQAAPSHDALPLGRIRIFPVGPLRPELPVLSLNEDLGDRSSWQVGCVREGLADGFRLVAR